ncbi:MAG: hypothetical protein WCO11_02325 [Sphingomonadales bacterium]|jgi:hypothetical protein
MASPFSLAPIVPAHLARERRLIVAELRERGAHSPRTAIALAEEERPFHRRVRAQLQRSAIVVQRPDGSVWLDEAAWRAFRTRHLRLAFVVTALILLGLRAIIPLFG